jgi:probable HAF family extracellular repeat protein
MRRRHVVAGLTLGILTLAACSDATTSPGPILPGLDAEDAFLDAHPSANAPYTVALLALPPNYVSSQALAINDQGVIVGTATGPDQRATRWTGGVPQLLQQLAGSTTSFAYDVNAAGMVVGAGLDRATNTFRAVRWDASGKVKRLGHLGVESRALAMNASGAAVGFIHRRGRVLRSHAARWDASGAITDIHPKGWLISEATAINDRGEIAGWAPHENGSVHAFRWLADGTRIDLGPGGARDMNVRGTTVGFTMNGAALEAIRWSPSGVGTIIALGLGSQATDISDAGRVLGVGTVNGQLSPYTKLGPRVTPLARSGPGATDAALGLNMCGTIVGFASNTTLPREVAAVWSKAGCDPL